MVSHFLKPVVLVGVLCAAETALGQRITVQQPVFEQFTVGTTVSVPDRGSALLGSVSRAGDFSRSSGLFGLGGRSRSSFRDHSGVRAHVWIHDFEEMDRLLLEQATAGDRLSSGPVLSGHAGRAWDSLLARSRSRADFQSARTDWKSVPRKVPRATSRRESSQARAEKFYRLGLEAVERGAVGVARLHFRMAVRHGSKRAASQLADLDAKPSATLAAREE